MLNGSVNHLINHACINERREKNSTLVGLQSFSDKAIDDVMYKNHMGWAIRSSTGGPALSLICIYTKHDLSC